MRADLEHLHQWPRQVWHVWSLRPASQSDPVLSLHGLSLHFSLPAFLGTSLSIPSLRKPFSQPIQATVQSRLESRSEVSRLVWREYGPEIFKGGIWNQPGGSLPIYPQIPTESWSWWRASYTPPSLHWSFQACASAWQKGLPFRGGTRQWLRVWWKNEAVLMELPYGSEHSLEGI